MGKTLWQGLKKVFHALGLVQNFVLLAVFYFLLFGPMALLIRLFGRDLLGLRRRECETFWQPRPPEQTGLERARRQS